MAHYTSKYESLRLAVDEILKGVPLPSNDYGMSQDYGGEYDGQVRTFVRFNTGKKLRNADLSRTVLVRVQQHLDDDGHFGHVLHFMRGTGDYVLIVQFGDTPILS